MTATDGIGLTAGTGSGTTAVAYHATIDFHGVAKLASPVAEVEFERIGDQVVDAMTAATGARSGTGPRERRVTAVGRRLAAAGRSESV